MEEDEFLSGQGCITRIDRRTLRLSVVNCKRNLTDQIGAKKVVKNRFAFNLTPTSPVEMQIPSLTI